MSQAGLFKVRPQQPCGTTGRRVHAARSDSDAGDFNDALSARVGEVRGAADWAQALDAAIALLDWSNEKTGYYERYRKLALRVEFTAAAGAGATWGSEFALVCSSTKAGKPPFRVLLHKRHLDSRVARGDFNFERR